MLCSIFSENASGIEMSSEQLKKAADFSMVVGSSCLESASWEEGIQIYECVRLPPLIGAAGRNKLP